MEDGERIGRGLPGRRTIYLWNRAFDNSGPRLLEVWVRTKLDGVYWETSEGTREYKTGAVADDQVCLVVPFGVASEGKRYVPPEAYRELACPEQEEVWSLQPGDKVSLSGEGGAYIITRVKTFDYGSPALRHWEVSAKV